MCWGSVGTITISGRSHVMKIRLSRLHATFSYCKSAIRSLSCFGSTSPSLDFAKSGSFQGNSGSFPCSISGLCKVAKGAERAYKQVARNSV